MRRQMELIRRILEYLNQSESPVVARHCVTDDLTRRWCEPAVAEYHLELCAQAGFTRDTTVEREGRHSIRALQLTWAGHEKLAELERGV